MRYSLLTPRHLLRPLHLHLKSRGQTLLLGRHVLLQANHLEEEEEGEEEGGGAFGSQRGRRWDGQSRRGRAKGEEGQVEG